MSLFCDNLPLLLTKEQRTYLRDVANRALFDDSLSDAEKLETAGWGVGPAEKEDIVRMFLGKDDLSRRAMCVLLGPPYFVDRKRLAAHPLYPLYCFAGEEPEVKRVFDLTPRRYEPYMRPTVSRTVPYGDKLFVPPEEK